MLRLQPTRKAFAEAGALHTSVNLFGFWDEHAFVTKSGDAGVVLRVSGVDYESLDHAARDLAVKRLEAALRVFDERTRIYQLLFKSQADVVTPAAHPNPLVQAALEQRERHLAERAGDLYKLDIYFVLLREGAAATASALSALKRMPQDIMGAGRDLLRTFASEKTRILIADQIQAATRQLEHRSRSFMQQLEDLVRIELLPAEEAFGVLYRVLNFEQWKRENARLQHELAETKPDAVVVFGDDQAEIFNQDFRPALMVYSGESVPNMPYLFTRAPYEAGRQSGWAYGPELDTIPIQSSLAQHVVSHLMAEDFDLAHAKKLDEGVGICGKEGQSVPVGVGMPTVRIDKMTVGGTG